ncbi:hypothetical protein Ocin01_12722 [Orchesella cincta]|uniref:Uncharacterized protein n=1 Tax=Orchesella cincta TaxID=48709 RepID=A0A1D2MM78_ORCCI|nr:hypothetical protein Ocin01_12722 [Orchesella cincta]
MYFNKLKTEIVFTVAIFILASISHGQALNQNQAIFYQNSNCSGSEILFVNNTIDDLTTKSWASNASSILFTGLWKYGEQRTVGQQSSIVTDIVHGASSNGHCVNKNESAGQFRFVEKLGPDDTESNQITLCTEQNFTGLRFKVVDRDISKMLPNRSIAILSWFLAGNKAWYIYSGKEFMGNRSCICPGSVASAGNSSEMEYGGLAFNLGLGSNPIIFGSAKIAQSGCLECTYEPAVGHKPSSYSSYFLYILATSTFFMAILNII